MYMPFINCATRTDVHKYSWNIIVILVHTFSGQRSAVDKHYISSLCIHVYISIIEQLFILCSHHTYRRVDDSEGDPDRYAFWAASVVGLFLHILAVAHAMLWGFPGSIIGSIVSTLLYPTVSYTTCSDMKEGVLRFVSCIYCEFCVHT